MRGSDKPSSPNPRSRPGAAYLPSLCLFVLVEVSGSEEAVLMSWEVLESVPTEGGPGRHLLELRTPQPWGRF